MPLASPIPLVKKLLARAEQLDHGHVLFPRELSEPREHVLAAMGELLRSGLVVGMLRQSPCGQRVEDATLFGITAKGKELRTRLDEAGVEDGLISAESEQQLLGHGAR